MHIVRFCGGFANQLFQLCFYNRLVELYGKELVYADISHYDTNNDHGGFKLGDMYKLNYINSLPKKLIRVNEVKYETVSYTDDKDYYYDGYWQSEKYFPQNVEFINGLFDDRKLSEANRELIELINISQSVSIHVRRGDYLNYEDHCNIANLAYFNNAISYMEKKIDTPVFFVFSDDISWCKEYIRTTRSEIHYVSGNDQRVELDMLMMSRCKHNIIANSSFSWWAQKLNRNEKKMVISPEYWYNEEDENIVPEQTGFIHVKNIPRKADGTLPKVNVIADAGNNKMHVRRLIADVFNQSYVNPVLFLIVKPNSSGMMELLNDYISFNPCIRIIKARGIFSYFKAKSIYYNEINGGYTINAKARKHYPESFWKGIKEGL